MIVNYLILQNTHKVKSMTHIAMVCRDTMNGHESQCLVLLVIEFESHIDLDTFNFYCLSTICYQKRLTGGHDNRDKYKTLMS